jgi:hypothetical protein
MLARISFRNLAFSVALAAVLASGAAGQVGYFYPPYPTWPPGSPGFYPAPTPPIFQPYQLAPYYGSGSLFLFSPGYLPYGSVLIQPGYPGPYSYPYYGAFPYEYQYRYHNWYYSPQGPYLWRWHRRDYGPRGRREPSGPTDVRPREGVPSRNQEEPALYRNPRSGPRMTTDSGHERDGPTEV